MSDFRRCSVCGEHGWFGAMHNRNHVCAPTWEARIFTRQYVEEWTTVYATDAEGAAAKFCEQYDEGGDYDIIRRGGEEIEVRKSEGTEVAACAAAMIIKNPVVTRRFWSGWVR